MQRAAPIEASWNPFRCAGAGLAAEVLLALKLASLLVLVGAWPPGPNLIIEGLLFGAGVALWLNRRVRSSAFLFGAALLVQSLQAGVRSETVAVAVAFLAASLLRERRAAMLGLVVGLGYLLYAMRTVTLGVAPTLLVAGLLVGVGLCVPQTRTVAVWLGLIWHAGALGIGWLTAPALALVGLYPLLFTWPRRMEVFYDGDCGFCEATRGRFEKLDLDGVYDWKPFQSGGWEAYGITEDALLEKLHVVASGRVTAGFAAFKTMLFYNPLSYLLTAFALVALLLIDARAAAVASACLLLFLSPLFAPIGEAGYAWIARNRHRLPGDQVCKVR